MACTEAWVMGNGLASFTAHTYVLPLSLVSIPSSRFRHMDSSHPRVLPESRGGGVGIHCESTERGTS